MQLFYFGWVRTQIGVSSENVSLPPEVSDVYSLIEWLKQRGHLYQHALNDLSSVRVAVNQEVVNFSMPISQCDEVALFPPMTGG